MRSALIAMIAILFCAAAAAQANAQPALLGFQGPQPQNVPQLQVPPPVGAPITVPLNSPPAMLVLPAGTIITIEASELLSSRKQHAGDSFVAELQHPLVVDGWVVARPGQVVMGKIAAAKKAGRVKGKSRLSLEIQQVVMVDGRQMPVQSELVENSGPASHGRDIAAVAITTGVGAAIGSICGAKGAAIGAAVGATASIAGVLLTRGEETEITPEKLLTFRLSSPLSVSTEQSQQAFWKVTADDYNVPEKVAASAPNNPGPVIVSQPYPRRVPLAVWPETQGLAAGRPGHKECGN